MILWSSILAAGKVMSSPSAPIDMASARHIEPLRGKFLWWECLFENKLAFAIGDDGDEKASDVVEWLRKVINAKEMIGGGDMNKYIASIADWSSIMLGSCLLGIRAMTSLPHCTICREEVANASEMRWRESERENVSSSDVCGGLFPAQVRRDSLFLLNKEEYPATSGESWVPA